MKNKIVVIRLGSLGDVALLLPVLEAMAKANPKYEFHFITKKQWIKIIPAQSSFLWSGLDFNEEYKGLRGVIKLFQFVKSLHPILVADMHDVARTKLLRILLRFTSIQTSIINKGRNEKKRLTAKTNKELHPLKHATERYIDVFRASGTQLSIPELAKELHRSEPKKIIGIAPFAKWKQKIYPLHLMEKIVELLVKENYSIIIFGFGAHEFNQVSNWTSKHPNVSLSFQKNFKDELSDMKKCDLIVCMDSASLHIASLYKIPTISIWGATHPYMGFTGFNQPTGSIVQNETLACRPCSVFGDKPCFRGDLLCMNSISPEEIVSKIKSYDLR
jgi:ADP-heptose:LPS heptosyltransferase